VPPIEGLGRRLAPGDFRGGIAVGTLYGIDHELLPRAKVRINVLPDDRALAGDLEEPAKPTLVDERIPVWQTLRRVVFIWNIGVSRLKCNMQHMYHIMRNSMAGARNDALRPGYGVPYLHGSRTGHGSSPSIGSMKNATEL
jgi:hypothetical protein